PCLTQSLKKSWRWSGAVGRGPVSLRTSHPPGFPRMQWVRAPRSLMPPNTLIPPNFFTTDFPVPTNLISLSK
ncbi:mCG145125, partial [Mus musculus]